MTLVMIYKGDDMHHSLDIIQNSQNDDSAVRKLAILVFRYILVITVTNQIKALQFLNYEILRLDIKSVGYKYEHLLNL